MAWLGILTAIGLLGAACVSVADPEGWAAPTTVDDNLFASIKNGKMAALVPAGSGFSTTWIFPPDTEAGKKLDLEAIYHTPIISAETVYFAGYDGNVYALNAGDGAIRWTFETDGPIIGGLALADGTIFVGSDDGNLYALNPEDGRQK
ncbi:MAG: PQQ-binding-like beta-propeller repeat protein, partial [Dehalococcoidia bacterium]